MASSAVRRLVPRSPFAPVGWVVAALLCVLPTAVARADDTAAGAGGQAPLPGSPPEFSAGPEAFLVPTTEGGPLDWLAALKGQLERLRTPPPTSPNDTQLRSAWESILEPRIANMLGRLEKWQDTARWELVPGQPGQTTLKQDQWPGFVQSVALLTTELHGAWLQYQNVKIKRKSVAPDAPHFNPTPTLVRLSYPVSGLYQSILQRQTAARQLGVLRAGSHWHLLGRFRTAWNWSWEQSSAWYRYLEQKEAQAALEKFEQALEVALEGTRGTLTNTLLGVQAFVATVQEAEQQRLQGICVACRTDDATLRQMAETALRDMEVVQLQGESFQGPGYAKYGALLRSWSRAQHAAVRVLEITEKRLADDEPGEAPAVKPAPLSEPAVR